MAQTISTTNNLRYHMSLKNGGTRYIDIENPVTDTSVISANITNINTKLAPGGQYEGILTSEAYFNGDSDATVTAITSAETIQIQKITTTTNVFS